MADQEATRDGTAPTSERFAQEQEELGVGGIDARTARLVVPLAVLASGLSTAMAMNPKMSPWWSLVEGGPSPPPSPSSPSPSPSASPSSSTKSTAVKL